MDKKMKTLEELAIEISDVYAEGMNKKGPMHIAVNECFTGYLHSFQIRGILAHYQHHGKKEWLEAAKTWADWSIRMQGTYGDPAAYNMGYLFETEDGIPKSWFVADTTDQAVALLNVAYVLEPSDPLYIRILESILKFDSYIQQWNLGKDGFALGYMDGEKLDKVAYHCAVARCISYYSGMYLTFGKKIYHERGVTLVNHMLEHDDFSSNYHGAPSTNRCYASFALLDAYYVLTENDDELKQRILKKVAEEIIPWAIENQTKQGFWAHDRFGHQPGAAKPIDKTRMGSYTWGVLLGIDFFGRLLDPIEGLDDTIKKCYEYMQNTLTPGDINRWGNHCWGSTVIAAKLYPHYCFPMGVGYRKSET